MSKKIPTNEALDSLSDAYGTSSEKLYDALLKQSEIYPLITITEILFFGTLHIIYLCVLLKWWKSIRKRHESDFEEFAFPILTGLFVVFTIAMVIGVASSISDIYTSIYNPDYWMYEQVQEQLESLIEDN